MHVSGELFAEGTATERILLTSMGDPEITPGRASATSPLALDRESRPPQPLVHWPSMRTNASWFKLSYVDIRYAGPIDHRFVASIHVNTTGRFEMDNSTIKYGMSDGLQIGYSPDAEAMTVSRSVISDNGGKGISVYEGYVDVRYGTVVMGNGGSGIYNLHLNYQGKPMSVMNSDIVNNAGNGIFLHSNSDVTLEHQSYGHGNNIYGNGGGQLASFAGWYLQNGSSMGLPRRVVDWSDNYWGALVFENACPWSGAPSFSGHSHISFEKHPPPYCEEPPEGPINYHSYGKTVPPEVCSNQVAYCAVDVVNAVPPASEAFDNSLDRWLRTESTGASGR